MAAVNAGSATRIFTDCPYDLVTKLKAQRIFIPNLNDKCVG